MRKIALLLFSGLFLSLTGCAELLTHRTFIDEMDRETDPLFVPGEDFQVLGGDSGQAYRTNREILERTPLSGHTKQEILEERTLRKELQQRELALSPGERERYYGIDPYLAGISEKIYYLKLSDGERRDYEESLLPQDHTPKSYSYGQRDSMVSSLSAPRESRRDPASVSPYYEREERESGQLFEGMTKAEVRSTWGSAMRVEVAGNPRDQNERWAFYTNGNIRYVYFEGGVVRGWELD